MKRPIVTDFTETIYRADAYKYTQEQEKYIDYLESQANHRAIGELEVALSYFEEDGLYAVKGLKDRIKQLKQN